MIRRFLQLPGIAPSENALTRRSAFSIWRISVLKKDALFRQAIESRRIRPFAPISAHMHVGRIVHDAEQDIRAFFVRCIQCGEKDQGEKQG